MEDIAYIIEEDPVFAVLGFVTSKVKSWFGNNQFKQILEELEKIEKQIDFLQ